MIRVLLVDDHLLFAQGMTSMFTPEDGISIIKHTPNGKEVPHILNKTEVDLILMDIDMPAISGIETLDLLASKGIDVPVLMLTMHQSMKMIKSALERGAYGYILKDASKAQLIEAIQTTSEKKNYFHSKINDQIFNFLRGKNKPKTASELSNREIEVIKHLSEGRNSKAIAEKLFISEHTVRTHRRNIMHKVQVKNTTELIGWAIQKGIIEI